MDSYNDRSGDKVGTETNEISDSESFNIGSFGSKPNAEIFAENTQISRPETKSEVYFETSCFRKPGKIVK